MMIFWTTFCLWMLGISWTFCRRHRDRVETQVMWIQCMVHDVTWPYMDMEDALACSMRERYCARQARLYFWLSVPYRIVRKVVYELVAVPVATFAWNRFWKGSGH